METLPQDTIMLMSLVNMKLRDFYPSLEELCSQMNLNREELTAKLAEAGFEYSTELNKFW